MTQPHTVLAAALPQDCPEGPILDEHHANGEIDRFFTLWAAPLGGHHNHPSLLYLAREGEEMMIRHPLGLPGTCPHRYGADRCLLALDYEAEDYTVEGEVSLDHYLCCDNADNSSFVRPMAGLVARFQNNRRYIYWCIQPDRCALYERADDDWTMLFEKKQLFQLGKYYALKLECRGNRLQGWLNGERLCDVVLKHDSSGMAGFRFHTAARIRRFYIWQKDAPGLPKPLSPSFMRKLQNVDLCAYMPFIYRLVRLPDEDSAYLVTSQTALLLVSRSGEILWKLKISGRFPSVSPSLDIIGVTEEGMLSAIDGVNGKIRRQILCPVDQNPNMLERYRYLGWMPESVNLRGTPSCRDFLVRSSESPAAAGSRLYAYDENLNLLWKREKIYPPYGHHFALAPVRLDGDQKESIWAGCTCIGADGEVRTRLDRGEEIANHVDGLHVDACLAGDFSGRLLVYLAAGSAGFYVADARTGQTLAHDSVGHAQCVYAGHFLPDCSEIVLAVYNRWSSYGTVTFFEASGRRLHAIQPDHMSEGGPVVNWDASGSELLTFCSGGPNMGLYDGYGRLVVSFPEEVQQYFAPRSGRYTEQIFAQKVPGDPRDHLFMNLNGVLTEYAPAGQAKGQFAPRRRLNISR